jgi:hypothetical protein
MNAFRSFIHRSPFEYGYYMDNLMMPNLVGLKPIGITMWWSWDFVRML